MSCFRLTSTALIAVTLFCVTAAQAAEPPKKERAFGSGKGTGALLTRDELRTCMGLQTKLKSGREEAMQTQSQLGKDKEEIDRLGVELKDKLAWLDRTSQEQVDRYNVQANERDKMIEAYQARTTAYNTSVDALNADRDTWVRQCENRRYDENHELLIKSGK